MKKFLIVLFFISFYGNSQEFRSYVDNAIVAEKLCGDGINESSAVDEAFDKAAYEAYEKILSTIGISASKRYVFLPCEGVSNAAAMTLNNEKYIFYNREFLSQLSLQNNYWTNMSILAHEIGHHIYNHSIDIILIDQGYRKPESLEESRNQELQSDYFSGFILAKMDATLAQASEAISLSTNDMDDSNSTHPSRSKRLEAIQNGYIEGLKESNRRNLELTKSETLYPNDNLLTRKYHNGQIKYQRVTTELNQENGLPTKWIDKEWYFNGKLKYEKNYVNDKLDGVSRELDSKGDTITEINYKNGKKNGVYKEWSNGILKYEKNYLNNILDGLYNVWYSNGTLQIATNYKNGLKHGVYWEWYFNGKLKYEKNYVNDKLDGVYREWYFNGILKYEKNYVNDKLDGVSRELDSKGDTITEINYKNGKKNGVYKEWSNGILKYEKNYLNNILDGLYNVWYSNGTLQIATNYKNGLKHGVYWEWDENGKLKYEKNYVNDKLDGVYREWYENGKLKYEINYFTGNLEETRKIIKYSTTTYTENGLSKDKFSSKIMAESDVVGQIVEKKQGSYKGWYSNGKLKIEGYYFNNYRHGEWKLYHENGQINILRIYFSNINTSLPKLEIKAINRIFGYGSELYKEFSRDGDIIKIIRFSDSNTFYIKCSNPKKKNKLKGCGKFSSRYMEELTKYDDLKISLQ